jgi:hypothetical protein
MQLQQLLVLSVASLATVVSAASVPRLRGHVARQGATPTQCTSTAVQTIVTINRGDEGIWVIPANQTGLNQLYDFRQAGWLSNNHTAILDQCTSVCFAGNNTDTPGTWLPSGKYFEGAFVNTPGGIADAPLWQCACYDNTISQANLAAGGGVRKLPPAHSMLHFWIVSLTGIPEGEANPGSGTIINRVC